MLLKKIFTIKMDKNSTFEAKCEASTAHRVPFGSEELLSNALKIYAYIPAKGISETIPKKNMVLYKGEPLVSHSIKVALASRYIQKVIVDTNDEDIEKIAHNLGAIVPYTRPLELCQRQTTDLEVFQYFLKKYEDIPDIFVHLRPTYPNRTVEFLDQCIEKLLENIKNYDSLRTVVLQEKSPYKMYLICSSGLKEELARCASVLVPLFGEISYKDRVMKEPYNECRQSLPQAYLHNGCIDIVKRETIERGSMCGTKILPVVMNECNDIDTYEDLKKSEKFALEKLYNQK